MTCLTEEVQAEHMELVGVSFSIQALIWGSENPWIILIKGTISIHSLKGNKVT